MPLRKSLTRPWVPGIARNVSFRVDDLGEGLDAVPEAVPLRIARTPGEVDALRESWDRLQGTELSTDPDWFLAVLEILPGGGRPHVIALERNGVVDAMLVANVRKRHLPCRLGAKVLYAPTVSTLAVVAGGALGRVDREAVTAFVRALVAALERNEADVCIIRHLPLSSPLRDAVHAHVPAMRRAQGALIDARWTRSVPDSYSAFLGTLSRGMRKGMTRSASRAERELGTRLSLRSFRQLDDLDEFFDDAESVAKKTYQRVRGVGFQDTEVTRRQALIAAEHGWFRGWVLSVDDSPIAYEHGYAYRGTFRWAAGGFDPAFAAHRPGMYLIGRVIQELCEDPGISSLDFGLGDADYKRRLGCESRMESDLILSARRLRPLWVTSVNRTVTAAGRMLMGLMGPGRA